MLCNFHEICRCMLFSIPLPAIHSPGNFRTQMTLFLSYNTDLHSHWTSQLYLTEIEVTASKKPTLYPLDNIQQCDFFVLNPLSLFSSFYMLLIPMLDQLDGWFQHRMYAASFSSLILKCYSMLIILPMKIRSLSRH